MVRKLIYQRWIPVASMANRLVVALPGAENVTSGLIFVVQMCLGRSVCIHLKVLVCRMCLGHKLSVKENIEPKRGNAILDEVEDLFR